MSSWTLPVEIIFMVLDEALKSDSWKVEETVHLRLVCSKSIHPRPPNIYLSDMNPLQNRLIITL
jgi:hypothetical protein